MHESALQLSTEHREAIILSVIKQATPRWWKWPFNSFNVCPLNSVAELFNIDWQHHNSSWLLLQHYHCVGYWTIPREIRQRIPELIREALSSKVRLTCEIEKAASESLAER
jgi:hypothetical protein